MIRILFQREFAGYFRTPVAYVFLVAFVLVSIGLAWFVGDFFASNEASLERLFLFFPWVYLFLIPAVGMRLWSEEKHQGTEELLLTLPITPGQAVLGKFLAGWAFVGVALLLTFPMPLTVAYLGDPDWGMMFGGYFGALLMAGAYLGICSLASALTQSQVVSFVLGTAICLVLVFLGWSIFNDLLLSFSLPVWLVDALANFSFITHYQPMTLGLITLEDVLFHLSVAVVTLGLTTLVISR